MTVTSIAASAVLLGVSSSLQTTQAALEQAIAAGMAQQMLDEIAGCYYSGANAGSAYQTFLGPSGTESHAGRWSYDDIDDFNGMIDGPPSDPWGVPLGSDDGTGDWRHQAFRLRDGYLDRWRRVVDVYYVSEADLVTPVPVNQPTDYRVVRVQVYYQEPDGGLRLLAEVRRVFAYVQAPTP